MTREQLDKLRGHTPGPWRIEMQDNYMKLYFPEKHTGVSGDVARGYVGCANAALIAAAPALLAHIDEQQRKIQRLVNALERAADLLQDAIEGNDMPRLSDMDSINAALDTVEEASDD